VSPPKRKRRGVRSGPTAAGPLSAEKPAPTVQEPSDADVVNHVLRPPEVTEPTAAGPLTPDGPQPEQAGYDDPDYGQVARGATGSMTEIGECQVCYAQGGGGHGSGCPNAGRDPADWVTEPPDGWDKPAPLVSYG
jgi:hypothetical protein